MACFTLIETNEQLTLLCEHLYTENELAIDLEADSLHHYREKVCLLQISNRTSTWLIDPLRVTDLKPLAELLSKEHLLTVFHGGDYDIRSLHRDFGISVARMFDTMIASQFLGIEEFGLAALLRSRFGIELDKRFQKADWSKRPLTCEMANYAAEDTANLLRLADELRNNIEKLGRSEWVVEECAIVASSRVTDKGNGPLFLHCKGAGRLKPRSIAILEELLQLRNRLACDADRPAFKILSTESLITLAERVPKTVHDMNGVVGITHKVLHKYEKVIFEAIQRGVSVPEDKLPRFPRSKGEPNPGIKARIAHLKSWRESLSKQLDLATGIVAPNWLLERIAEQRPTTLDQLSAVQGIRRWQKELWGNELLTLLAKEAIYQ